MAKNYLSLFDPYTEAIFAMFKNQQAPMRSPQQNMEVPLAPLASPAIPTASVNLSSTDTESSTNPDGTKKTKEQRAAEREAKRQAKEAAKNGQKSWINSADFVAGDSVPTAARVAASRGIAVPVYTPMPFSESAPIGFRQGPAGVARAEAARQAAWLFSQQLDPNSPYHEPYMREIAAQQAATDLTSTQAANLASETAARDALLPSQLEQAARTKEEFQNRMDVRRYANLARATPFSDSFGGNTDNMSFENPGLLNLIATGRFRNPNEGYLADSSQVPPGLAAYALALEAGARAQTIEGNDLAAAGLRSSSIRPEDSLWSTTGGMQRDEQALRGRQLAQQEKDRQTNYSGVLAGLWNSSINTAAELGDLMLARPLFDRAVGQVIPDSAGVDYNYLDPFKKGQENLVAARTGAANAMDEKAKFDRLEKTLPLIIQAYKANTADEKAGAAYQQALDQLMELTAPSMPEDTLTQRSTKIPSAIEKILAEAAAARKADEAFKKNPASSTFPWIKVRR